MAESKPKLVSPKGAKSYVWQYFGFDTETEEKKTVQCKLCSKNLPYSGNTTNLSSHLKEQPPRGS